jgi:hypothetical protein
VKQYILFTMPMKLTYLVLMAISLANAGCGHAAQDGKGATQSKTHAVRNNLVIRKAVYGYLPDGPTADVTDKVRQMAKNGTLSVAVADRNFGDPSNGTRKLTITKAIIKFQYSYPADATDVVKGFQVGNELHTTGNGRAKFTVYYSYGDGRKMSTESGDDGSLNIAPPTRLRVDYAVDGIDSCKIVNQGQSLEISGKIETPVTLHQFLGSWGAEWGGVKSDMTVEMRGEKPIVTISDSTTSNESLECGGLSYNTVYNSTGYEFVETVTPTSNGLELSVFRLRDGRTFSGKLTKK